MSALSACVALSESWGLKNVYVQSRLRCAMLLSTMNTTPDGEDFPRPASHCLVTVKQRTLLWQPITSTRYQKRLART